MSNIIKQIEGSIDTFQDREELKQFIPELIKFYTPKIKSLIYYAYDFNPNTVAYQSFLQSAETALLQGMETYIIKYKYWEKENAILDKYLKGCLLRVARSIKFADEERSSRPICPACKIYGERIELRLENRLMRCDNCTDLSGILKDMLHSNSNAAQSKKLENELRLRNIFALHTRKGYRCPDCSKFVPESYFSQYGVSCPYNDCMYFGVLDELELMNHPMGLFYVGFTNPNKSLDYELRESKFTGQSVAYAELGLSAESSVVMLEQSDPSIQLDLKKTFKKELEILNEVVGLQINRTKANDSTGRSKLKLFMYQAYKNLIRSDPDDMVAYLVHRKYVSGTPIQAKIFQEYVKLVENALPFRLRRNGEVIEIYSLLDPNLNLFLGMSEFDAIVKHNHVIPNNTKEVHIGARNTRQPKPCYIGMLIDIVTTTNGIISLRDKVEYYSFEQIHMESVVEPGIKVHVKHLRIPGHYEMGGLVQLQRLRRKIVDSVYYRIHGKKREVRL